MMNQRPHCECAESQVSWSCTQRQLLSEYRQEQNPDQSTSHRLERRESPDQKANKNAERSEENNRFEFPDGAFVLAFTLNRFRADFLLVIVNDHENGEVVQNRRNKRGFGDLQKSDLRLDEFQHHVRAGSHYRRHKSST